MAIEIGYFTPSEADRVWKAVKAFERGSADSTATERGNSPSPIYFKSVSAEVIPPYGCIQMVGTEELAGRNYILVDRPIDYTASVMGPFLLNGPNEVEANGLGTAQMGPVYRAISDGGAYSVGTRFGPVASSFELSKGPLFSYIGDDDLVEDCVRVIACETPLLAVAGGSGIADHVSICSNARIGGRSGVTRDITTAGDYLGFPAERATTWRRMQIAIRRLSAGRKAKS